MVIMVMRGGSRRNAPAAVLPVQNLLLGLGVVTAASSAAAAFFPSVLDSRRRSFRQCPSLLFAAAPATRPPRARAAVSSIGVESEAGFPSRNNAARRKKGKIDEALLVKVAEDVPPGKLTQDQKRDMLTVMRQLSSNGRRLDDFVGVSSRGGSYMRHRREDATTVERLLDRMWKEHQYSAEPDGGGRGNQELNARTFNLAIKAWANANVRGSAERAERILKKLKVANINTEGGTAARQPAKFLRPDLYSFAYCYAAWYRESTFAAQNTGNTKASSVAMRKAESVLQSMKQVIMTEEKDLPSSQSLNIQMAEDINSLIIMWSNDNTELPGLSEKFLRFIESESRGTEDTWLNTRSYNLLIKAWAKSGSSDSIDQAEALLREMEGSTKVKPDLLSYSGVISCMANSKTATYAKRAEDLLYRMMANGVEPDNVVFNQVMNIHSKKGFKGSAGRCEKLLKKMETLAAEGNEQVAPDVRTWNMVLSAYANEKGPSEAEKILDRIETCEDIQPNNISYVTCMDSYAKIGDAHNSLRILSLMEKAFDHGNSQAKPTKRAYVSALNSLAKSGRGDAGTRAEQLVQTMEKMHESGKNTDLEPDITVYNTLINCHKNSAARAEKVLYRMGKRDVISYSSVINVYSKMGGVRAAERGQALLDEMQREDVLPNAYAFNSAITAWGRSGSKDSAQKAEGLLQKMEELYKAGNTDLQPSAQVYTSVISAWAKSNEPGSALRAEILLKLMWGMYKRGNKSVKPNTFTFTSVINAWARSRDRASGERSEALLDQMIKLYEQEKDDLLKPNVLTFTSVINAYARNGARDAASKASGILKKMESVGVEPNLQTYNVLISLWGNSQQQGAGKKAEGILAKLEDFYLEGKKDMRPTVVSYTSCINAWAKSTEYGKAQRANAVLDRMKELHSSGVIADHPNEVSYSAVINSCATTYGEQEEKQEAFRIAYSTFKEMSELERLTPNHVSYSSFMRAISKLVPDGDKKDSLISAAFRLCIRGGQLDGNCLFHMKNAASSAVVADLLGCDEYSTAAGLTVEDLPFSWTRNVKTGKSNK